MMRRLSGMASAAFVLIGLAAFLTNKAPNTSDTIAYAQGSPTSPPAPAAFDQAAAVTKLKEQIKGREHEPAPSVFKNIQTPFVKSIPAGRLLAVMEFGYARSLGVTCTHCHTRKVGGGR